MQVEETNTGQQCAQVPEAQRSMMRVGKRNPIHRNEPCYKCIAECVVCDL